MSASRDIVLERDETLNITVRPAQRLYGTANITAITNSSPVRITAPGHGLTDGWYVAVFGVQGMVEINSRNYPPPYRDFNAVTVVDTDTVEINAVRSEEMYPYISGGALVWPVPLDLTNANARLRIWETPDRTGDPIVDMDTDTGVMVEPFSTVIIIRMPTVDVTWPLGYYQLDVIYPTDIVECILLGTISVR